MESARRHGTVVSYDLNYRPSLWEGDRRPGQGAGGQPGPGAFVDVMLGNEEDFTAALGFEVEGLDRTSRTSSPPTSRMMARVVAEYPNLRVVATTLRNAKTATRNDWGASARPTAASTTRRGRISRSWTASGAATRSPRD